ncbi:MAG: amidoligase family protein, partial [Nanoarchaeota archaeon]
YYNMGKSTLLRVVSTFDGTKAIKGNCRYIKGEYYEQNRQCFMMPDGKWHRVNNGKIAYDHKYKSWKFLGEPDLKEGIVGGDSDNIEFGYFTVSPDDLVLKMASSNYYLLDESLIKTLDLVEDIGSGMFYRRKDIPSVTSKNYVGSKKTYKYPIPLDYNSKHQLVLHIDSHRKLNINNKLPFYDEELDGVSFGIEFEVWEGTIPFRKLNKLGLIPLLDGSLRHNGMMSYEYATIPLNGATGLAKVKAACDALTKYTQISEFCSLHVHLGGYKPSPDMIASIYRTAKMLESDLYSLFPKYYKNTAHFKQKSYCGPLPNFRQNVSNDVLFRDIYSWLSNGRTFHGFTEEELPDDPSGNHKWNIPGRYHFLNLIPFIWGPTGTVEFRLHPPTTNAIKTINWIFICNAIMKYANLNKNNGHKVKQIGLMELISMVYDPKLTLYLNSYIQKLKDDRIIFDSVGDYVGAKWCKEDPNFTFPEAGLLTKHFVNYEEY